MLILAIPCYLFSLSFHEASHAFAAWRLGDPTAKLLGRMTLNPLSHLDPIGTTLLVIGMATGIPVLAWAKPVPFDPRNLKSPRRDGMWIALAGPLANLVLAVLFAIMAQIMYYAYPTAVLLVPKFSYQMIYFAMQLALTLNVGLFLFNFIPLDPLDGGKILRGILPLEMALRFDRTMAASGRMIAMIAMVLIFSGTFGRFFSVPVRAVGRLLLGEKYLL